MIDAVEYSKSDLSTSDKRTLYEEFVVKDRKDSPISYTTDLK
jgi:hypothetical protein